MMCHLGTRGGEGKEQHKASEESPRRGLAPLGYEPMRALAESDRNHAQQQKTAA
jgi:hypothetical protein